MNRQDPFYKEKYILGNLFFLSNKLQTIMDQKLKVYEITTKQWFLIAAIEKIGGTPSTIDEIAATMGCSHQNVKQLALKLEQKGFVKIVRDEKDRRVSRIAIQDKTYQMKAHLNNSAGQLFSVLFGVLGAEQINSLYENINRVAAGLEKIDYEIFLSSNH